jgi:geranylgeranyl diphosphate synthase, type II
LPSFPLKPYLEQRRREVDASLRKLFASLKTSPPVLRKAMAYSIFAGGKRLRPVLCLASAEAGGLHRPSALRLACALELVHTYSLIHDDLPALDDDDFRRGRPTNHKVFGEAMAVLAGDGLLTLAFEWISNPAVYPVSLRSRVAAVTGELARASGWAGMVGGQVDDVSSEGKKPSLDRVLSIHRRKTGALLAASTRLPALLSGASLPVLRALESYGRDAGLAFQIVDDVLNVTGDARKLGKAVGSDRSRGKMTYPAVRGLDASRREIVRLTRRAVTALAPLGPKAAALRSLAEYMADRSA